jgi:hypothetical protein
MASKSTFALLVFKIAIAAMLLLPVFIQHFMRKGAL